jgi:membrane peptidoglycan carboxypeptidase
LLRAIPYGIWAASRHYFGRSAARLDLTQASLLAGLIQAPSDYDQATCLLLVGSSVLTPATRSR